MYALICCTPLIRSCQQNIVPWAENAKWSAFLGFISRFFRMWAHHKNSPASFRCIPGARALYIYKAYSIGYKRSYIMSCSIIFNNWSVLPYFRSIVENSFHSRCLYACSVIFRLSLSDYVDCVLRK
jgi:hypothetical protein